MIRQLNCISSSLSTSFLLALIWRLVGEWNLVVIWVEISCDELAKVLLISAVEWKPFECSTQKFEMWNFQYALGLLRAKALNLVQFPFEIQFKGASTRFYP